MDQKRSEVSNQNFSTLNPHKCQHDDSNNLINTITTNTNNSPEEKPLTRESKVVDEATKSLALKRWNQLLSTSSFSKSWELAIRKRQSSSEGVKSNALRRRLWRDQNTNSSSSHTSLDEIQLKSNQSPILNQNEETTTLYHEQRNTNDQEILSTKSPRDCAHNNTRDNTMQDEEEQKTSTQEEGAPFPQNKQINTDQVSDETKTKEKSLRDITDQEKSKTEEKLEVRETKHSKEEEERENRQSEKLKENEKKETKSELQETKKKEKSEVMGNEQKEVKERSTAQQHCASEKTKDSTERPHGRTSKDRQKRVTIQLQPHTKKKKSPRIKSTEFPHSPQHKDENKLQLTQQQQQQQQQQQPMTLPVVDKRLSSSSSSRLKASPISTFLPASHNLRLSPAVRRTVMLSPQRELTSSAPSTLTPSPALIKSSVMFNEYLRKRRGVSVSVRWSTTTSSPSAVSSSRSHLHSPPVSSSSSVVENDTFASFVKPLRRVSSEKWLNSWDMPMSYVTHNTSSSFSSRPSDEVVVDLPSDFVDKLQDPSTLLNTIRSQRMRRRPVITQQTSLHVHQSENNNSASSVLSTSTTSSSSSNVSLRSPVPLTATQSIANLNETSDAHLRAPLPLHKHPYFDVSQLMFDSSNANGPQPMQHAVSSDNIASTLKSLSSSTSSSTVTSSRSATHIETERVIAAGPLLHLINALVHPTLATDSFLKTFFLAYRHFLSSGELLEKLIRRYNVKALHGQEEDKEFVKYKSSVQEGVVRALTVWIETCFSDFINNEQLIEAYTSFQQSLRSGVERDKNFASKLHQVLMTQMTSHEKTERLLAHYAPHLHVSATLRLPLRSESTPSFKRLTFLEIHPYDLARQLTLRDFHYFRLIDINEYTHLNWMRENKENLAPNVLALIQHFNEISYWVASEIVSTFNKKQRCTVLKRLLQVAKYCRDLNNFHALMAIYCGLNMQPVQRLHKTWKCITTKEYFSFLKEVDLLFDSTENYKFYRSQLRIIREKNKPAIPFQGIYLKTLMFIEENPDTLGPNNDLLNVVKMEMLAKVYQEIQHFQRIPYQFEEVKEIQFFLATLDVMSDKALYENSKRCEPAVTETPQKKSNRSKKY